MMLLLLGDLVDSQSCGRCSNLWNTG